MHRRCRIASKENYKNYGGRGISVCERWNVFENFVSDMGEPPIGMSLDRIDNDKGYAPDNCRWADRKTQNRNRRLSRVITVGGVTMKLCEWADVSGLTAQMIYQRIKRGWSPEKAIREPIRRPLGSVT